MQRQKDSIHELLESNRRGGFYVCELDRVAGALKLLATRVRNGHTTLVDELCRLLDLSTPVSTDARMGIRHAGRGPFRAPLVRPATFFAL